MKKKERKFNMVLNKSKTFMDNSNQRFVMFVFSKFHLKNKKYRIF